jgi:hypothetical protein
MVPIVFGAGVMDIGLFAYWWTGIAGNFTARPITETGVDQPFLIACAVLAATLIIVLLAAWRPRRTNHSSPTAGDLK